LSTSRILADILLVEKNKYGGSNLIPDVLRTRNGKLLLANEFLTLKMVKIYIFEKIIGRKSQDKNINKTEKY
jgi:hypothetical protein